MGLDAFFLPAMLAFYCKEVFICAIVLYCRKVLSKMEITYLQYDVVKSILPVTLLSGAGNAGRGAVITLLAKIFKIFLFLNTIMFYIN